MHHTDSRPRGRSRLLATSVSLATLWSTLPACDTPDDDVRDATVSDDDLDRATDDADDDTPRRDGDASPSAADDLAAAGYELPPPLPDPSLFGVDPDPRHWDLPHVELQLPASHAADVDPGVTRLDVELDMRPSERRDRYVEMTLDVTARDADGNALAWFEFDSERGLPEGTASAALLEAMVADLLVEAEDCDALTTMQQGADVDLALTDAADAQAGGGGGNWPGGGAWWARALCQPQRDLHLMRYGATAVLLGLQAAAFSGAAAACTVAGCADAAGNAAWIVNFVSRPSLDLAVQLTTLGYVVADNLRNLAGGVGLGGIAGANAWPVAVIGPALVQMSVGRGALAMTRRSMIGLLDAVFRIAPYPQLNSVRFEAMQVTYPSLEAYRAAQVQLLQCYDRVARWIAGAGLVGLVAVVVLALGDEPDGPDDVLTYGGAWRKPGGPTFTADADVQAAGLVDLSAFSLVSGPTLPRANQYAAASPLVYDIATLPSYQGAATLIDHQGRTQRHMKFGYAEPNVTVEEDAWGLDEFGLPTLLAAAGSPVLLTSHVDEDLAPKLEGEGNRAIVRAVMFDLVGQEVDAVGGPIGEPFACVGLDNTCPLFVETTGSPEQIAAGETVTRHWSIIATSSIVDVTSGVPIELPAGYRLTITAPRERPLDPCFDTFDPVAWQWLRNHTSEECGPGEVFGGGPGPGGPGGPGPGGPGGPQG